MAIQQKDQGKQPSQKDQQKQGQTWNKSQPAHQANPNQVNQNQQSKTGQANINKTDPKANVKK